MTAQLKDLREHPTNKVAGEGYKSLARLSHSGSALVSNSSARLLGS
jgi:hypothetical protein